MLDKQQILIELQRVVGQITHQARVEQAVLQELWQRCIRYDLLTIAQKSHTTHLFWSESMSSSYPLVSYTQSYQVLGIDGSQIYPDRHQGVACYLLNMGVVRLLYLSDKSQAQLQSKPFVYNYTLSKNQERSSLSATELVNYQRAELELYTALHEARVIKEQYPGLPLVVLFDGPLYFWHLYTHDYYKQRAAEHYIPVLHELYAAQIPVIGYISFAKNKDLLSILQAVIASNKKLFQESNSYPVFEQSTDADICKLFLEPGARTCTFTLKHQAYYNYSASMRPCFVYLALDDELVRVEFSHWLLDNPLVFESTLAIVKDQCTKGRGYPVALAEAHEQAVVKGADRDYFYELLHTIALQAGHDYICSNKSLKKRFVSY